MTRPGSSQLHVRIPVEEKDALREEAASHQISMSALVRISIIQSRATREREAMKRQLYPDTPRDTP